MSNEKQPIITSEDIADLARRIGTPPPGNLNKQTMDFIRSQEMRPDLSKSLSVSRKAKQKGPSLGM